MIEETREKRDQACEEAKKMEKFSAAEFAEWCFRQQQDGCGYIMAAIGQDPKRLPEWYFSGQYLGKQLEKANYWREHAPRVFDCQGLADGYLTEKMGRKIDVRARNNYATWCGVKGEGMIPAKRRVAGAAVFKRGSYVVDVNHQITNLTGEPINAKLYMQLVRDSSRPEGQSRFVSTFTGPAVYSGEEKFQKLKFSNLTENGTGEKFIRDTKSGWIAMVQHYFVSAFIPTDGLNRENYAKKLGEDLYCVGTELQVTDGGKMIQPQQTASNDTSLYMGPQDTKLLEKAAPGLDLVKDYGFLTVVAKPIFWLMNRIHDEVGNWGWTIVILTILIKLALSPLSHMGYKSMARMRKFTPVIQRMKERYKDDPQTMKTEMISLYKREKINPAGGCLPMIVQIPVFLSLYWVLLASIEIRNAPWLGWIHNLAAPDPWYILPVIMAGTMFLQQKMSPPPPDPMQAKIMMFVPIAFSITFFFFPAGLVLYWIVNNVLSIGHHYYINKQADKVIAAEQAAASQAKPVTSKTKRR